ncbi:hypothetical protein [Alkalibacillus salilacus]|uniref:Inhibitor of sigma-G Gin n=1 Tax=Alkalibacillus salilacus TaxID=284582 RepID=A0ABT9VD21_9BACI|nr:hypothetical protein [Alkalibacillus salilacus]MDQ0158836.1 hypothetical protein [Alkalibacillus salilacus]
MCNGNGVVWVEVITGAYDLQRCDCENCEGIQLRKEPIEQTFKKWDAYIEQEQRMKGAV